MDRSSFYTKFSQPISDNICPFSQRFLLNRDYHVGYKVQVAMFCSEASFGRLDFETVQLQEQRRLFTASALSEAALSMESACSAVRTTSSRDF